MASKTETWLCAYIIGISSYDSAFDFNVYADTSRERLSLRVNTISNYVA